MGFAAMLAEAQTFDICSLSAMVTGRTSTKKNLVTFIHKIFHGAFVTGLDVRKSSTAASPLVACNFNNTQL